MVWYAHITFLIETVMLTTIQADNDGILTIATTNHPERIDDAILNRPSRFDVKYEFTLPDAALRKAFAEKWLAKVNAMTANSNVKFANSEEIASTVAGKTEGWSFAFLKELYAIRCLAFVIYLTRVTP